MGGPFYELINEPAHYVRRKWFTQKPPFLSPLYYSHIDVTRTRIFGGYGPSACNCQGAYITEEAPFQAAYNQAYSRFQSKLGESAAWGENLAQYKQTFETAVDLLELCLRPTRKIAKALNGASRRAFKGKSSSGRGWNGERLGRFVAKNDLSSSDRWVRPLKEVNAAYLQWVYGLKPLMSDLVSTVAVLDGASSFDYDIRTTGKAEKVYDESGSRYWKKYVFRKYISRAKISATVHLENPNLHKAQQLGITNPVALAYELIPFSFILDYLVDIGGYLSSFDDLLGLTLKDSYVTQYSTGFGFDHFSDGGEYGDDWTALWLERTPVRSLPAPKPYLKLNVSHWQAIHACSILASIGLLRGR